MKIIVLARDSKEEEIVKKKIIYNMFPASWKLILSEVIEKIKSMIHKDIRYLRTIIVRS